MRQRQLRMVVSFPSTADAIGAEKILKENNIEGRLIPIPREMSAGCGLAWSAPAGTREELEKLLNEKDIRTEEWREFLI